MNNRSQHIKKAHNYWKNFLQEDNTAIDATLGNGYDTLALANLLKKGLLYGFDIQKIAIDNTKEILIKNDFNFKNIFLFNASHVDFESFVKKKVNLIVYNLGYLPGSDKLIKTGSDTIKSLKSALNILDNKGALSITCYPGHAEGEQEEKEILAFLKGQEHSKFEICYHKWLNKEKAPSLIWIKKLN